MPRRIARVYREAYSGLSRDLWLLALTLLVNRAGSMVLAFLTLYLTQSLGFSKTQAGQILGLYGVGSMMGAWLGGWLSDRLDPNLVQRLTLITSGTGFILFPLADGFGQLAVGVVVLATLADAFRPAVMVAAVRYSTPEQRPRAFALIRLAMSLGMTIGPALGGFLASQHYDWLFYVDGGTCILAAGVHLLALRAIPRGAEETEAERLISSRPPWKDGPYMMFLGLTLAVAIVIFQLLSTWPLYLREAYLMPERSIGLMFAANSILIAAFEMLILRRIERRSLLRTAGVGALIVAVGMAILPIRPPLMSFAILSLLVWTFGEMLFLPITSAVVGNRAGRASTGSYMGAYAFCYSLALVIAPVVGTTVYEKFGAYALWYGVGATGPFFFLAFRRLAVVFDRAAGSADAGSGPDPRPGAEVRC